VTGLAQQGDAVMREIDDIFRLSKYHEMSLQACCEAVYKEVECFHIVIKLCYGEQLNYASRSDVSHHVLS
jgi:hypothetical protein